MKRTIFINTAIAVLLFFVLGCSSSPQKSLAKKDYSKAYKLALKKLKENPSSKDNTTVLITSLKEILKEREEKAKDLNNAGTIQLKEKAISNYEKMIDKIEESSAFTIDEFNNYNTRYTNEIESIGTEIKNQYYQNGMDDLAVYQNSNYKSKAKSAYYNFSKARKYYTKFDEIDSLLNYALESAHVIYAVEPDYGMLRRYSFDIDNVLDDLERESNKFITIEFDPVGFSHNVDCEIEIDLSQLQTRLREDVDSRDYEEEIISGTDTIEVTGTGITTTITRTSTLNVRIDSRGSNCSVKDGRFSESVREEIEQFSFTGDERAVPSRYKRDNREEFEDEDDVVEELIKDMYSDIRNAIL